jgi:hypothetical protein
VVGDVYAPRYAQTWLSSHQWNRSVCIANLGTSPTVWSDGSCRPTLRLNLAKLISNEVKPGAQKILERTQPRGRRRGPQKPDSTTRAGPTETALAVTRLIRKFYRRLASAATINNPIPMRQKKPTKTRIHNQESWPANRIKPENSEDLRTKNEHRCPKKPSVPNA